VNFHGYIFIFSLVENFNQAFWFILSGGILDSLFACAHEEGICFTKKIYYFPKSHDWV
jgi:hypothetical protein